MTKVTVPHAREDAPDVVEAALERTDCISMVEVETGGDVLVGVTNGRLTSFGEEVVVELPPDDDSETLADATRLNVENLDSGEEPRTVVSVTAHARKSYNLSANPSKSKSDFIETLHEVKHEPVEELRGSVDQDGDDTATDGASLENEEKPVDSADVMVLGAKFMFLAFLVLLSIVLFLAFLGATL